MSAIAEAPKLITAETLAAEAKRREEYARNCDARQRMNKPGQPDRPFLVEYGEFKDKINAQNDREAWAKFCDANKVWPPPRMGKVTEAK
jgi:hypothetical protein